MIFNKEYFKSADFLYVARMYDPGLGRWLVPDPAGQFHSPYLAMGNAGHYYTDPDGRFVHLIVGAVFGGVINWIVNGANFDLEGLKYFGVGALSGALGAGIGAGVSAAIAGTASSGGGFVAGFLGKSAFMATGFASGFVVGTAAGFSSGFTSSFGNALIKGINFKQAFNDGIQDGIIGGVTGGFIGGIASGIDASINGRNFWTGASKQNIVLGFDDLGNQKLVSLKDYEKGTSLIKDNFKTKTLNPNK